MGRYMSYRPSSYYKVGSIIADHSGVKYRVEKAGNLVRVNHKLYKNKKERRRLMARDTFLWKSASETNPEDQNNA